jgi:hypothetical protein
MGISLCNVLTCQRRVQGEQYYGIRPRKPHAGRQGPLQSGLFSSCASAVLSETQSVCVWGNRRQRVRSRESYCATVQRLSWDADLSNKPDPRSDYSSLLLMYELRKKRVGCRPAWFLTDAKHSRLTMSVQPARHPFPITYRPALMWTTGSVDSPGFRSATLQSPCRWLPRAVVIGLASTAVPTGTERH